jgi:hypothetical protein
LYAAEIVNIVDAFWDTRHLGTILVLILISRIASEVPDDFILFLPQLIRKSMASLGEIQTSEWFLPQRQELSGSSSVEVEKLALLLTSIRKNLRGVIGEYLHILVPALLKIIDSLLLPSLSSSGRGLTLASYNHITVSTLQTLSHLLQYEKCQTTDERTFSR